MDLVDAAVTEEEGAGAEVDSEAGEAETGAGGERDEAEDGAAVGDSEAAGDSEGHNRSHVTLQNPCFITFLASHVAT